MEQKPDHGGVGVRSSASQHHGHGFDPQQAFCVSYMLVCHRWYDNEYRKINNTHKRVLIHGERPEYR